MMRNILYMIYILLFIICIVCIVYLFYCIIKSPLLILQGDFGSILYTGDFRFEKCFKSINQLPKEVDVLYLDNTYCSEKYMNFPSRIDALEKILDLSVANKNVRIITPKIGKENILMTIASALNTKVVVDESRMKIIKQLEDVDCSMFTTNMNCGKVKALPYKLKVIKSKI